MIPQVIPYVKGEGEVGLDQVLSASAEIYKVQTLVDFGIRVTLDLLETDTEFAYLLMKRKNKGGMVMIGIPDDERG